MLTWILLAASLFSLAASLYKDRKTEKDTRAIKKALLINYAIQALVVILATINVVQGESDAKTLRIAQNDRAVLEEVLHYQVSISDNYMVLVRNASSVRNCAEYQRVLGQLPPKLQERTWESAAPSVQIAERDAAARAFAELQRISRELLALQIRYGDRVPQPVTEWAKYTVALQFEQLSPLLRATPEGMQYANMLGNAFGVSVGELQSKLSQIEQ